MDTPQRRTDDPRVQQLVVDVDALKTQMKENTEVTKQVRDILGTFKVTMAIGKWVAAIGGAVYALIEVVKGLRG